MAVLMQAQIPGVTKEMADGLAGNPDMAAARKASPGYLGFAADGPMDGGWQVIELWDSPADHQQWVEKAAAPNMPTELLGGMTVAYHEVRTSTD